MEFYSLEKKEGDGKQLSWLEFQDEVNMTVKAQIDTVVQALRGIDEGAMADVLHVASERLTRLMEHMVALGIKKTCSCDANKIRDQLINRLRNMRTQPLGSEILTQPPNHDPAGRV